MLVVLTSRPLRDPERLDRVLSGLDRDPSLRPTHWGPDGADLRPWDPTALRTHVANHPHAAITLRRDGEVRANGTLLPADAGIQHVDYRVDGGSTTAVFALADALATATEPELGVVHPVFHVGDPAAQWNSAANITRRETQKFGLRPPAARTWFGPHLVALLAPAVAGLSPTEWGGARFDLLDDPSDIDLDAGTVRQREAMTALGAGLFADWQKPTLRTTPAPAWVPIPDAAGPQGTM